MRRQTLWQAVLRGSLAPILDELSQVSPAVPVILLKGQALGELLYGKGSERATGDLDLLVLPGDREAVQRVLWRLGYERLGSPPRMWVHNQEPYRHPDTGVIVEVHWSLAEAYVPAPAVGAAMERRMKHRMAGEPDLEVNVLPPDLMGLHLALHFHHHLGHRRGLEDMQGWWRRFGDTFWWTKAREESRIWGMEEILLWPLMILGSVKPAGRAGLAAKLWRLGALTGQIGPYGPFIHGAPAVLLRAALMGLSDPPVRGIAQPILRGPHRVGRTLAPQAQRFMSPLG